MKHKNQQGHQNKNSIDTYFVVQVYVYKTTNEPTVQTLAAY